MIRCVAIDDEPLALGIIKTYCGKLGGIELETFTSPKIGMARIKEWNPDVVLLDIELNGVSGIELAKSLPLSCCLIFTTAYARYALEGFEVNAVDFLHKPYFYERFCRAMEKASQQVKMRRLLSSAETAAQRIVLKSDYKNVSVATDEIVYIESIDNYVRLHMTDGSTLLSKTTLQSVLDRLPSGNFIRIHRSFIVSKDRVVGYNKGEVVLSNGKTLPIGKKYADEVESGMRSGE